MFDRRLSVNHIYTITGYVCQIIFALQCTKCIVYLRF